MSGLGQRFAFPPLIGGYAGSFGSIPTGASSPSQGVGDKFGQVALNVKDFGAKGDGSTDDTTAIQNCLNAAYGTSGSPHGASVELNSPVYFPAGHYIITSALTLRSVRGAHIYGAGRFTTAIENTTANGSVFTTNGFEYSIVERMEIITNGTGNGFNLDWDNTGSAALQSNTFRDIYFTGGARGLSIGETGNMGSESLIENCYFQNHSVAGLHVRNANALANSVIGGNFAQCALGIYVAAGSAPLIIGVSFQNGTGTDIKVDNSNTPDTYAVVACRSESDIFCRFFNGSAATISGCTQSSATAGVFAHIEGSPAPSAGSGTLTILNCDSKAGVITGGAFSTLYILGNPARYRPLQITNVGDNGGGKMRITVANNVGAAGTAGLTTGEAHYINDITGTGAVSALNGTSPTVTVVTGTTFDLLAVNFGGTYTSGGVVDGVAFRSISYLSGYGGTVAQNI